ncbi:MAG: DUF1285 domain-containing protein [Spongiibacteraceae bacterium]
MISLDEIEALLRDQPRKPPVEKWQPPLSGEMNMRIDSNGDWYHEGTKIQRQPLVNLFASILRREEDGHFYLLTPVEKWRISVDDAPLIAVDADVGGEGDEQKWVFTLNTGERVQLDAEHPLTVAIDAHNEEPRPYVQLDRGLDARINRAVFYRLIDAAEERDGEFGLRSVGHWFALGSS